MLGDLALETRLGDIKRISDLELKHLLPYKGVGYYAYVISTNIKALLFQACKLANASRKLPADVHVHLVLHALNSRRQ